MKQFPDPILIPQRVIKVREERLYQLVKSGLRGILIRLTIIIGEFIGVAIFGSSSLLMDALASTLDVFSSVFLIVCIKFAARPPDENHPFGHGRFEPLIGLQLGVFIALVGCGMIFQQAYALSSISEGGVIDPRTWIIPFSATILLEICYQTVMRTAKQQHSPALASDAIHYRIDGLTSLFAAVALGIAAYYPELSMRIDHIGAIAIAVLMIGMGVYTLRQNLNQILDRVPEKKFFDKVRTAAKRVSGVRETEKIRIQLYGPNAHVDIDVEVDPDLSVEAAHRISQKVRAEIQKDWPHVQDVTVHIEPFYPNDH